MQAIIDACQSGTLDIDIKAIISNRPNAAGLDRATQSGIPAISIDHKQYANRESFDQELINVIDQYEPALVILAGFMRILSDEFVNHYQGRLLNIHPSLLPKYPGLNTHQRALEHHDEFHGASIHFVTTELDGGPVVIQVKIPIKGNDDPSSLAERLLKQEHHLYCTAIQWFAEKRLVMNDKQVLLDGKILKQPIMTTPL